jgi:hypothetical protein
MSNVNNVTSFPINERLHPKRYCSHLEGDHGIAWHCKNKVVGIVPLVTPDGMKFYYHCEAHREEAMQRGKR